MHQRNSGCNSPRYLGNSFYNIQNKTALNATGGKHAGFGMTVATLQVRPKYLRPVPAECRRPERVHGRAQLGVGTIYSFFIWLVGYNFLPCCGFVAPTAQKPPKMTGASARRPIWLLPHAPPQDIGRSPGRQAPHSRAAKGPSCPPTPTTPAPSPWLVAGETLRTWPPHRPPVEGPPLGPP